MAIYYWVGGTATWDASTTTHWASASGGGGGAGVPGTADTAVFDSNSGGGTVTTSGSLTVNSFTTQSGYTGTVSLRNAFTCSVGGGFNFNGGTFNTNNYSVTTPQFIPSGTGTRTLTLGSSAISVTGGGSAFNSSTITNMTVTANTAVFTISGAGNTVQLGSSTLNWNGASFTITGTGTTNIQNGTTVTVANLTYSPTAITGTANILQLQAALTVTGAFTVTGAVAPNCPLISSSLLGTQKTITVNGSVSFTSCAFQDIATSGTGWSSTTLSGGIGDCQGNSALLTAGGGIADSAQTNYLYGSGPNFSTTSIWYLGTGGTGGAGRVPLPQDTAILDANSSNSTVYMDTIRFGTFTLTGYTGSINQSSFALTCYGSVAMHGGVWNSNRNLTLSGRGSQTITCNGTAYGGTLTGGVITIAAVGGSYALQDNLLFATGNGITLTSGTLNLNGHNLTAATFSASGSTTRSLTMGSGTVTLTGSGTVLNMATVTNLTLSAASVVIAITDTTSSSKTFAGGGKTYGTLQLPQDNPGGVTITGANTFTTITGGVGSPLTLPSSTTTTISPGGFQLAGSNYGYEYLHGVASNYVSTPDSAALSITGDIDLRCQVALDNWATGSSQWVLSKWSVSGQFSYALEVANSGAIGIAISVDGTTTLQAFSSNTGFTAGSLYWIRATWSQSGQIATFYTSTDGVTWTQLGGTATLTAASIFDGTAPVEVGGRLLGTGSFGPGKYYRAQVYNGIAGTLVFDANFTTKQVGANTFTESSSNAATVTITGTAAQAGDGRVLINASSPGVPATVSSSSGTVIFSNGSLQDNTATGGAGFYYLAMSTSATNVTGWNSIVNSSLFDFF